ncbi:hypothetical protein V6N11_033261 [Hibiscus sabdariffa]|uniref:RRM domain-containing protein n=1 Tax=Hibiscus sabdariffa TaxID=183260 RepID=A0ABR2PXI0_9ROSI
MKGNRQKGAFSLYVDNLPESLHWQGLWHFFGQHVDVVDAYIANKLNKRGRRFGFVTFEKELNTSDRSGMKQENSNGKVHENSRDKNVQGNNNGNAHESISDRNIPVRMNHDKPLNRNKDCVKEGPWGLDLQSSRIGSKLSPVKGKLSWAATVDAKMNIDYIKRGGANTENIENFALIESHSEEEEPSAPIVGHSVLNYLVSDSHSLQSLLGLG